MGSLEYRIAVSNSSPQKFEYRIVSNSFRIVFWRKSWLRRFFLHFFRPKVNFPGEMSTIFRAKSWRKLTWPLEKGIVNFCQLFEMAVFSYSTNFIEYRIPLFDFLRPRISNHFFSNGSSSQHHFYRTVLAPVFLFDILDTSVLLRHTPLKPESRESLLEFLRDQYPERIKTRQQKT